jgi:hypothetical protein
MAHVVFMRAANVGGNNVFRPAQLAKDLAHLGVVNVGAAGTFVVRARASAAVVKREIAARLPFEIDMAIRPAREVLDLVQSAPFDGMRFSRDRRGWVAVLAGKGARAPRLLGAHARALPLPLFHPAGPAWAVRLERLDGPYAIGVWQRRPQGFSSPSQVIEDALGVRATTRWWETFERIAAVAGQKPAGT